MSDIVELIADEAGETPYSRKHYATVDEMLRALLRSCAGHIEQQAARIEAARKILEPMHDCDPEVREWLGMERWGEKA